MACCVEPACSSWAPVRPRVAKRAPRRCSIGRRTSPAPGSARRGCSTSISSTASRSARRPERKVSSTPTFLLAAGLPARTLLGVHYATNSELSPSYPNEWELFGRYAPLDQELGAPLDASAQVGYNLAAEGLDAEASVARRQGPVRLLAALRLLAEPGENGGSRRRAGGGRGDTAQAGNRAVGRRGFPYGSRARGRGRVGRPA